MINQRDASKSDAEVGGSLSDYRGVAAQRQQSILEQSKHINPIQDGAFWGCSRVGGAKKTPFPKICHTYPTIMELGTVIPYLKNIQKILNHVTHFLSSLDISISSAEISRFCFIKKNRYRLYFDTDFLILLTFFESLKIVLIKMVTILMMSTKMATLSFPKIKIF